MLDTTENESLVHRARNVAVGRFMQKTDADVFMFIDADVEFTPDAVIRLVKSEHDVSVAVYPKKVVMWDQVKNAVENGDEETWRCFLLVLLLILVQQSVRLKMAL